MFMEKIILSAAGVLLLILLRNHFIKEYRKRKNK